MNEDAQMPGETGPFHAGELVAQERAGVRRRMAERGFVPIRDHMPEQHRAFFAMLPFLALGTLDANGHPAASLLVGEPGFATSPDPQSLRLAPAAAPPGLDPGLLVPGARVGLLGIQLETRRRNRANGRIAALEDGVWTVAVEQSFGNCPQYIQRRDHRFVQSAGAAEATLESLGGLDAAARATIAAADTFFVASASAAGGAPGEAGTGVDVSHRGGRPGFVRIDGPSGGESLAIPDYSGNNYFNTLGNFTVNPRGALLFVDFSRGDLLHLSGRAEVEWSGAVGLERAERMWRFHPERGWLLRDALPLRWSFGDYAPTSLAAGIWGEEAPI